ARGMHVELLDVDPREGAGTGDLEVPAAQPLEVAAVEGPLDAPGRGRLEPVAGHRALAALLPQGEGGGRLAGGLDRRRRRGRGRAGDGGGRLGGAGARRRVHLLKPPPTREGRGRRAAEVRGRGESSR